MEHQWQLIKLKKAVYINLRQLIYVKLVWISTQYGILKEAEEWIGWKIVLTSKGTRRQSLVYYIGFYKFLKKAEKRISWTIAITAKVSRKLKFNTLYPVSWIFEEGWRMTGPKHSANNNNFKTLSIIMEVNVYTTIWYGSVNACKIFRIYDVME